MHCPEPFLHEDTHSPSSQECYLLSFHGWVPPRIHLQSKGAISSWDMLCLPQGQSTPSDWLKGAVGEKGFSSIWDISEVYSNFTVSHSLSWDSAVTESQLNFSVCWMLAPSLSSSGSSKRALPRKILWRRHGNPHQYSCLEKPMDRGAWWATVHRVAQDQI